MNLSVRRKLVYMLRSGVASVGKIRTFYYSACASVWLYGCNNRNVAKATYVVFRLFNQLAIILLGQLIQNTIQRTSMKWCGLLLCQQPANSEHVHGSVCILMYVGR